MYFPPSYILHSRKYDRHPYPNSIYIQQTDHGSSTLHPNAYNSSNIVDPLQQIQIQRAQQQNKFDSSLYSLSSIHNKGHYNDVQEMLTAFARVLEDILKYEKELEKYKKILLKNPNFSIKQLFNYFINQSKTTCLIPEIIFKFLQEQKNETPIYRINESFKIFCRDKSEIKIFWEEFVQIFSPRSLEGRQMLNLILIDCKDSNFQVEQLGSFVNRVFIMHVNMYEGQQYHNHQLWKMLADFRTIFKYIDYKEKGVVTAKDMKEFMEKNCMETKEFDTIFQLEDVELLISKFDRIGNGYWSCLDIIQGFLPDTAYDHRYV